MSEFDNLPREFMADVCQAFVQIPALLSADKALKNKYKAGIDRNSDGQRTDLSFEKFITPEMEGTVTVFLKNCQDLGVDGCDVDPDAKKVTIENGVVLFGLLGAYIEQYSNELPTETAETINAVIAYIHETYLENKAPSIDDIKSDMLQATDHPRSIDALGTGYISVISHFVENTEDIFLNNVQFLYGFSENEDGTFSMLVKCHDDDGFPDPDEIDVMGELVSEMQVHADGLGIRFNYDFENGNLEICAKDLMVHYHLLERLYDNYQLTPIEQLVMQTHDDDGHAFEAGRVQSCFYSAVGIGKLMLETNPKSVRWMGGRVFPNRELFYSTMAIGNGVTARVSLDQIKANILEETNQPVPVTLAHYRIN